jgi:hypothetical protein
MFTIHPCGKIPPVSELLPCLSLILVPNGAGRLGHLVRPAELVLVAAKDLVAASATSRWWMLPDKPQCIAAYRQDSVVACTRSRSACSASEIARCYC